MVGDKFIETYESCECIAMAGDKKYFCGYCCVHPWSQMKKITEVYIMKVHVNRKVNFLHIFIGSNGDS